MKLAPSNVRKYTKKNIINWKRTWLLDNILLAIGSHGTGIFTYMCLTLDGQLRYNYTVHP